MKTADLIGDDLDLWVARAEGHIIRQLPFSLAVSRDHGDNHPEFLGFLGVESAPPIYSPSTNPAQGQPIMERERISTRWDDETLYGQPQNRWLAEHPDMGYAIEGSTMLIAGMRARVAQVYGDEVPS